MGADIRMPVDNNSNVSTMAVWEAGYNICLDVFRVADTIKIERISKELRDVGFVLLYEISKGKSKISKPYVRRLRIVNGYTMKLSSLLMFLHDLGYINTDKYLTLNRNVTLFSGKLLKLLKYAERKTVKKK